MAPAPVHPVIGYDVHKPSSGISMSGMICGIGGLLLLLTPCLWLVAGVPQILGIIMSMIALNKISRGEQGGRGMAVAGLVCGIIGVLLYAVGWIGYHQAVIEFLDSL